MSSSWIVRTRCEGQMMPSGRTWGGKHGLSRGEGPPESWLAGRLPCLPGWCWSQGWKVLQKSRKKGVIPRAPAKTRRTNKGWGWMEISYRSNPEKGPGPCTKGCQVFFFFRTIASEEVTLWEKIFNLTAAALGGRKTLTQAMERASEVLGCFCFFFCFEKGVGTMYASANKPPSVIHFLFFIWNCRWQRYLFNLESYYSVICTPPPPLATPPHATHLLTTLRGTALFLLLVDSPDSLEPD